MLLAVGRTVLGTEEGKGPLPWTSYEQFVKRRVGADREGPLGRDPAAAGRAWQARRRGGGHAEDRGASTVAAATLEGEGEGLALLAYPSFRFYDGAEREPLVAAGNAGHR
mgnify:CR=1 FL=1